MVNISLKDNLIGLDTVIHLAKVIATRTCSFETIDLSGNILDLASATAISDALKKNVSLRELNLSNCKLGEGGAMVLASGLSKNNTLESLVIRNNSIEDTGAEAIGISLRFHPCITLLDLTKNNITAEGIQHICEYLISACEDTEDDVSPLTPPPFFLLFFLFSSCGDLSVTFSISTLSLLHTH